jgi:hypothetical protein
MCAATAIPYPEGIRMVESSPILLFLLFKTLKILSTAVKSLAIAIIR